MTGATDPERSHDPPGATPGSHPSPGQPPREPQGRATEGRTRPDAENDDGSPVLAPREVARMEASVRTVGRRDRAPVVVAGLVAAAFLLGLLRPWDLVVPPASEGPGRPTPRPAATLTGVGPGSSQPGSSEPAPSGSGSADTGSVTGPLESGEATVPPAPRRELTCAFPQQWRTATIEEWSGRRARVWKATEVVAALRPDDPAIRFEPIFAATITAIGWCAPVEGPERPPLAISATLYRLVNGIAVEVPYDRLEPREPDALGELWVPTARGVGNRPPWPLGRYVIELRSASGGYLRYLGLELSDRVVPPSPILEEPARTTAAPSGSPSPAP